MKSSFAALAGLVLLTVSTVARAQLPDDVADLLKKPKTTAKEEIDLADEDVEPPAGTPLAKQIKMRVRVVSAKPAAKSIAIGWMVGGEGQGGAAKGGWFRPEGTPEPDIDQLLEKTPLGDGSLQIGQWTEWTPISHVLLTGSDGWRFPRVWAQPKPAKRGATATPFAELVMEFEFQRRGKTFKRFSEPAPRGPTVGFAFPGRMLASETTFPQFVEELQGLSTYAHQRRERLERLFSPDDPLPQKFAIIGHLGGYGEGSGYGIRHCNPEIVADECRTQHLLGINGMIGHSEKTDFIPETQTFRRILWAGSGVASIATISTDEAAGCPYDPRLLERTKEVAPRIEADIAKASVDDVWVQAGDEIGVAVKDHMYDCPRCQDEFRKYLQSQGVTLEQVGATDWSTVKPFRAAAADAKLTAAESLLWYYTYRFMTHATAQIYAPGTALHKAGGTPLFSMMAPTPSWGGATLDWHEFYDGGANSAVVWETSNRDPRVWQWESYLGDMVRNIAARHEAPIGCLIKPHRGAPLQRMLSVVSRGATVFEWYTYGPDYAKGDSFSQAPWLLEEVAKAGRFLGKAEPYLYGAEWLAKPQVALVIPRSGQIWGATDGASSARFEDAKWVYMALTHAHVPVDILSEKQLAEGALDGYKVAYVLGPNLRCDAAAKLESWVRAGGTLWTDALGLARDEANEPLPFSKDVLGLSERKYESWGDVHRYGAVALQPLVEKEVPEAAKFSWNIESAKLNGEAVASVGREPFSWVDGEVLAKFADGQPALVRRSVGQGSVYVAGFWAGVTYSAKVRQANFDMQTDYDVALRDLIAMPAIERQVYRPVVPDNLQVEAVALVNESQRSVALMNWSYRRDGVKGRVLQPIEGLKISLPGVGAVTKVRSQKHGELTIARDGDTPSVTLPQLDEIDLLILE